jgi:formylglycine-generating enzyme required for sulfatase activity
LDNPFISKNDLTMIHLYFLIALLNFQGFDDKMVLVEGNDSIKSCYMDKYELTMAEFQLFVDETGHRTVSEVLDSGIVYNPYYKKVYGVHWRHDVYGQKIPIERYAELPVSRLTWKDAQAYAEWVGKRIPTKEEWLYAARGGSKSESFKYVGGNNARQVGWFDGNSRETLMPIGQKNPNELGIYDLGGNLRELALDLENNRIWGLGGSFFTDKDYFEIEYLENGVYSSPQGFDRLASPLTGVRFVKDIKP